MRRFCVLFVQLFWLSLCSCEVDIETREKFLNGFIDYLNSLPNQAYVYEEGALLKADFVAENTYKIETNLKASELHNADSIKFLHCTATVIDLGDIGISVQGNEYHCSDTNPQVLEDAVTETLTTEEVVERRPVQLDNEIQSGSLITSGEQFVAIPRDHPAPCIGCSTKVDPQAEGVNDLALLAVRHLDRHEPGVRHALVSVLDVERQVQVVNGVRYILTINIDYNNCTETETDRCNLQKSCKVTVLEKPWVKLDDGSKYRAILANNCTQQWLFGDNGEVVPKNTDNNKENNEININPINNDDQDKATDIPTKPTPDYDKIANTGSVDDILKIVHNTDLQAPQRQEKKITDEQLRDLQEQIIPLEKFKQYSDNNIAQDSQKPISNTEEKINVVSVDKEKNIGDSEQPIKPPKEKPEAQASAIPEDKKKAIDELMNFFNFAGVEAKPEETEPLRIKRSYDTDIKAMNLVDKFQKLKGKIENAKNLLILGQSLVDYLNEMDMEVKSRVLNDVIAAEEETDNYRKFVYLQARVTIPCEKAECDKKDTEVEICNTILETTKQASPQVLDAFCVKEEKKKPTLSYPGYVDANDPILHKLAQLAVKKIEHESPYPNAFRIRKILSGVTQKISGTFTKISLVLEFIDCNKTVREKLRKNCSTIDNIGTKVCEIEIHERSEFIEKAITYSCLDRPADESFTGIYYNIKQGDVNDPKVIQIAHEALQYLEVQSDRNNKAKIIELKSVSSKLVAGMLTNVEFVVGYTTCTNDVDMVDINSCNLIESEPLRICEAQVWDRPWLEDGRQMKVLCKTLADTTNANDNEIPKSRHKRQIPGGDFEEDASDPKYKALATESLAKYLQDTGETQPHEVVYVKKVKVQVVSGTLTKMDFTVAPSNAQSEVFDCHSEVWERPWLKSKKITVNCQRDEKKLRHKRQIEVGGDSEKDASDPKYKALATESLAKYLQETGETQPHEVVHVKKVKLQVVSGTLTKMDFTVAPSNAQSEVFDCHSEVWERPWLKSKEITVKCQREEKKSRHKRQIPGGDFEKDASDPKYKALATESLAKYLQDTGETQPHEVVHVKKVKVQVVAGTLTKMDFTVAPSNAQSEVFDCHSEVWERPWLKSKEMTVNCQREEKKSRHKRQMVVGGDLEKDASDPKYKVLASESLEKYLHDTGETQPHEVVHVKKVKVQVVSGTLTKMDFTVAPSNAQSDVFDCHSEVWERPWLKSKEITVNCQREEKKSRHKRQIVVGGDSEKDASDPKYKVLATESLEKYLQDTGETQPHEVVHVKKVKVQVVAGTLTKMDFTVAPSNAQSEVFDCHSEVWERPWLKSKEITVNCQREEKKSRHKRQIVVGGDSEKDASDPKYKVLASESLKKYLHDTGETQPHEVVHLKKVKVQVVSGTLTKMDFTVAPSNAQSEIFDCHSEVWERPWLKSKEITVNCQREEKKSRHKRQIVVGGDSEKDASDPKYKVLASESLEKYLHDTGETQPHEIVHVKKVKVQVVSGTLTKMDFTVAPSNAQSEVFDCHSEVWERPWLKSKEITVNCQREEKKSRHKRQIVVGGDSEKDASDPKYKVLASESLEKYLHDTGETQPHEVVHLKKVKVQVVSGTLTKMDFTVAPSNAQSDVFDCHSEVWERPWLKSKEIAVNCQREEKKSRHKRQIEVGGDSEKDASDPKYKVLATQSLEKYLQDTGETQPHEVVHVKKVKVQVVAGTLTKMDFTVAPSNAQSEVFDCHSEVWERPWLKSKEITVNCQREEKKSRHKRQIVVGGDSEKDASDPKYKVLASESLEKYLHDTGETQLHDVVHVKKVKVQVVSGTLTKMDFTVAPSNAQSEVFDCHSEVWERPWLKSKEITVNCQREEKKSRHKRQIVVGGDSEKDASDPKYKVLASESLEKYLHDTGETQLHEVVHVKKVKVQVVSGTLTKMDFTVAPSNAQSEVFDCHSEVWERPWLKSKEITVNCQREEKKSRHKRQIPGGDFEEDASDPKYKTLATESLAKYLQDTGETQPHEVVHVKKVKVQVVSGTLTKMNFTVAPSNAQSEVFDCHSEVWERPWLKSKEITVNCQRDKIKSRHKRQIVVGGDSEKDASDPKYKSLATESLAKYLQDTGETQPHEVVHVKKVKVQVVAGTLTKMDFTVAPSNAKSEVFDCHSEVWERPWLKRQEITVKCQREEKKPRHKRQIPGGDFEEDASDPKYKTLATESLAKYLQETGETKPHQVVHVKKVEVQVVSGKLTKIDFTVAPSNAQSEVFDCHSEVWERPWLHSKEITVKCINDQKQNSINNGHTDDKKFLSEVTKLDSNDETLVSLVELSLRKFLTSVGEKYKHQVIAVGNATMQLISGYLTKFDFNVSPTNCLITEDTQRCLVDSSRVIHCHSEVWEKPWMKGNNKIIVVDCENEHSHDDNSKSNVSNIVSDSENVALRSSQDVAQVDYKLLAEESLKKYQRLQNSQFIHKVIDIKSVLTQVVSGMKYKIDFTAAPTACSINVLDVTTCEPSDKVLLYCHTEIWDRPWLKRKEINIDCNEDSNEDDTDENAINSDISDNLGYTNLAEIAVKMYHAQKSPKYAHKVTKILRVSEQAVTGFLTKIEFAIAPTKCTLREAEVKKDCELLDHLTSRPSDLSVICRATIWELSAWRKEAVKVHCENPDESAQSSRFKRATDDDIQVILREKRQVPIEDDFVDDEIKYYYAQMVIDHINSNSRSDNVEKIITVYDVDRSIHMRMPVVRMYLEVAMTYCLREALESSDVHLCEEIAQIDHRLCHARLYPSPDDELVVLKKEVVCNDNHRLFKSVTGFDVTELANAVVAHLEKAPDVTQKLFILGTPHLTPSLRSMTPMKLNFIIGKGQCPKDTNLYDPSLPDCLTDLRKPPKSCVAFIWMQPNSKEIRIIKVACNVPSGVRQRRSVTIDPSNTTVTNAEDARIKQLVQESLEHLEMESLHRYKQRVLLINSYSTKINSRKVTTIDFDVGYTSCLKYEYVENVTSCEFLEHLPRRHCVSQVWEKLWSTGKTIEVNCEDDETPLEAHIEFESAENAMALAREALKHIEAKYPHPYRQKVVRIFSLEKQAVAGLHYRLKMEVGYTDCMALSVRGDCRLVNTMGLNRFCRVNVWIRPWTDHPPTYRVACDYQEATTAELYHHIQAEQLFYDFVTHYKPDYMNDDLEMSKRFEIFKANVRKIHELNIFERGTARYAVTRFTDLSAEEFRAQFLGLDLSLRNPNALPMRKAQIPTLEIPDHFDWREFDAVTEVKDQGSCGSCWAFSVTGNIEGQWKMQSGQLVSLSEQELVDCDKLDKGCNGGLPDNAYRAIEQLGGLELETDYPYEGEDDKCVFNKTLSRVQISGAVNISSNETDMAKWLVQNGPISIGINANAMQFYVGGVSHPWKMLCNPSNLDHGVLIVGYGVKDYPLFHKHLPYWIVKNSWGKTWGEQGYYRVYRGDGTCGVNMMASSAVI